MNSLETIVTNLIGIYTPVLDPVTLSIAPGMAGIDFGYITRASILLVVVYFTFLAFISLLRGFLGGR